MYIGTHLERKHDRGDDAWLGGQRLVRHHALQRVGGLVAAVDQRPPGLPRHLMGRRWEREVCG